MSFPTSQTPAITPLQTLEEKGAQIGEDWRDGEDEVAVRSMVLSPNGKTIAIGCHDGKVRLWDVETKEVIAKWIGHRDVVCTLSWSPDGKRVLSGSWDGMVRVWDVKSGETVETVLTIKTGHQWVNAVVYSPDATKIATGGDEDAIQIWDAKTGGLLNTLKHDIQVWSLAWTSDGKLISGSFGQIRIFDTATWQQIAILEGHTDFVNAISVSQNQRFLASTSLDKTARLWNLNTGLSVNPPLQHEDWVRCTAISADGKLLVTGSENADAYTWDIHAIFKKAGLEDLFLPLSDADAPRPLAPSLGTARKVFGRLSSPFHRSHSDTNNLTEAQPSTPSGVAVQEVAVQESFMDADATQAMDDELPPGFFDDVTNGAYPSGTYGNYHPSSSRHPRLLALSLGSARALFDRLSSPCHRSHSDTNNLTEAQPSTPSGLHPRALFASLSSLTRHSLRENNAPNELQQSSPPLRLHPHMPLASLSSLWPQSRLNNDGEIEPHHTTPSGLRPDTLIDSLSSLFRSQPHTNEEIELPQRSRRPRVVEVAAVRDREVIFTAPPPLERTQQQTQSHAQESFTTQQAAGTNSDTPRPRHPHSLPVRLLCDLVLFLCCASPRHANTNAQPALQQQGQPQGQGQAQASSSQTQPATPSASTTPPAPATSTVASGATTVHSRPLPLRARFVLFLCCASPPHADGH
ncbi:WD40-repeat-containing domain protein [Suillus discolor]|uniref:WD40-repeat-containing domain protein n=1 Tax=Suillus discolor TaxID=1912936 RepID=A0A9P7EXE4_9AGAM|nr:WD40-repeat-containing domain protein [Suillus discolor]KAG2096531.1 WD40-repeat-containing domain protein [Suillus discolor]